MVSIHPVYVGMPPVTNGSIPLTDPNGFAAVAGRPFNLARRLPMEVRTQDTT